MAAVLVVVAGGCGGRSAEETLDVANDAALTPAERCDAIADLAMEGEAAVAPLHALTRESSARVARCARKALADVTDPEAVDALAGLLRDRDAGVVASAAEALGWIGDAAAVRPLARVLGSRDPGVVTAAVEALGGIGGEGAVGPVSKVALRRPTPDTKVDQKVRWAAVVALGDIGHPAARATLVTVLGTDPVNSRTAGVALARTHPKDVTPLLSLLDDPRNIALAYALVDVGQKGTEDALVSALAEHGDVQLAEYFLNCGNGRLERAAQTWASNHGYTVYTQPGVGGDQWGSGL